MFTSVHILRHSLKSPCVYPTGWQNFSPKPYTKSGVFSSQACLLLRNRLGGLLEPVSDAGAGVEMKGFCLGTGSIQQGLRRRQDSGMVHGVR